MSPALAHILYWLTAYLIGAIPFGWIFVKIKTGRDIRYIASGRMGMSNVTRVAGKFWGILTAVMDVVKGIAAIHVARLFAAEPEPWMLTVGGILAVLGHIYSIFMIERRRDKRFYFRGGAGGLTSAGVSVALWIGFLYFMPIPCFLIYQFTGYASVTVALFNVFGLIAFIVGALTGQCSWWYCLYSIVAEILVLDSLRPNFKRLRRGDERKSSLTFRKKKEDQEKNKKD